MTPLGSRVGSTKTGPVWRRPTFWWLVALVVAGAIIRFSGLAFGLPHTQARPDETAIIDPVRSLLSGRLPHFFDYPWLYLWVVAVAYLGYFAWGFAAGAFHSLAEMLATWPTDWYPFFLIPRALSALVGTASIVVIYQLGRRVRDDATGLVSALFLTFGVLHARSSHFGTTDVTMTFLILCSAVLIMNAHQTRRPGAWAAAGFVAGLAAATKYNAVLLAVPVLVSQALLVLDSPGSRWQAAFNPSPVYFGLPFLMAFAVGVPFVVLDSARFLEAMRELSHALQHGDTRIAGPNGWTHHVTFSLRWGLGLPLLVSGLAGAVLLVVLEWRVAALLLSFPVAYYLVAGSFRLVFVRYMIPVEPFLCVTAAYGISRAAAFLAAWAPVRPDRRRLVASAATVALAVGIAIPSMRNVLAFNRVIRETDSRVLVARWFAEHVPEGSSVLQTGSRYGLAQFERRLAYREWRWDSGRGTFLIEGRRPGPSDRPDWIVLQDSPLPSATQEVASQYLAEGYTPVSEFKAFTPSDALVYDRQDAFFVPLDGLEHVIRPGPNFSVYRREGVRADRDGRHLDP